MPLVQKPFADIVTFSRASGATRVNAVGLIVGVDFSATSVTIGTGAKTFTLTATASVNRDWPVGSALRAVDQVGGGTMNGTVTSYSPVTQELVINVASVTGSGTSTNWRIGSLEFRRDFDPVTLAPRGGLVEGQATNGFPSSDGDLATFSIAGGVTAATTPISGFTNSVQFGDNSEVRFAYKTFTQVPGTIYTLSVFVQMDDNGAPVVSGSPASGDFSLIISLTVAPPLSVTSVGGNVYRVSAFITADTTGVHGVAKYTTQSSRGFRVTGFQIEAGPVATSYIPTTTVAVTRAADLPNVDGQRLLDFYNNEGGVLYVEATPLAAAVSAVAASLNDGTLANSIRIGQKQSGTLSSIRAIASDGVTDVMALNSTASNTLRSNGIDYTEVSDGAGLGKFAVATSGVGSFLNGGGTESIFSSADSGLTYTSRTIGGAFGGAHFGIGRFVVCGSTLTANGVTSGSVIVSTDGLSFRRINIPGLTQNLNEVTSNGTNQYVAVGNGGVIYTSPDAETWTAQTSGAANNFSGVHFFGGRYVATSITSNETRYSDNGTSWTAVTGLTAGVRDVHHNGTNLWVAVGSTGAIYSSPDGITWTSRTSGVTANLNGVHFADGLWVVVGNAGTVVTSPDGITWTDRAATSGTTQTISEVNFFNGFWYWVGNNANIGQITTASLVANATWTLRSSAVIANLQGIATNGTRLLVCGLSDAIATSDDGTTFTSRTGNAAQLNGAAFGAGNYVVVGNAANGSGLIATVDPTTFAYRRVTSGLVNATYFDALYAFGRWMAVTTNHVSVSTDNVTWTSTAISNSGRALRGIGSSGSLVVIVGDSGVFHTTADGITFSAQSAAGALGTSNQYNSVTFGNGAWVTVGNAGSISTSPNGTTWTLRTSGVTSNLFAVRWNTRDQCFYAAGDSGAILRSADGITWENIANDAVTAIIKAGQIKANPNPGNWVPGQVNRVVTRFSASGMASSINGGAVASDSSVEVIVPNRLSLGMDGTSAQHFNGHLRRIGYRTDSISDASLVEVSAGNVDFFTASQGGLA